MKKRIPILNNEIYSKILFLINEKEIYASQISSKLNKTQATTQRQLMNLVKEKYLDVREHPEKKKNIKLFSIRWEKIIEEFLNFLRERKQKLKLVLESEKTWDTEKLKNFLYKGGASIDLLDKKNLIEIYQKNRYLLILFKESFKLMTQYKDLTIKEVFDKIIELQIRPLESWSGRYLGRVFGKYLKSHSKEGQTKFRKLPEPEIELINRLSKKAHFEKKELKKKDKELREYENLMEICSKLTFDPIKNKIDREITPKLIKEIFKNEEKDYFDLRKPIGEERRFSLRGTDEFGDFEKENLKQKSL